jgi:hypothetical protein
MSKLPRAFVELAASMTAIGVSFKEAYALLDSINRYFERVKSIDTDLGRQQILSVLKNMEYEPEGQHDKSNRLTSEFLKGRKR